MCPALYVLAHPAVSGLMVMPPTIRGPPEGLPPFPANHASPSVNGGHCC
jgi:hypothetical protein